jgi:hypothetical protein
VTAQLRERRQPGWGRIQAAAAEHDLPMAIVRKSGAHVLCEIGSRQFVLPTGDLPAAVADQVITSLRNPCDRRRQR